MAKSGGGLFSLDRAGTIGDAITFTSYKGKPYVRIQSKRKQPQSGLQIGMRSLTAWIASDHKNLFPFMKNVWVALAKKDDITPLNAQIRDAQNRQKVGQGWRAWKLGDGFAPSAPTISDAIPNFRSTVLSWVRPPQNERGFYSTAIYLSLQNDIAGVLKELRLIVPVATTEVQVLNLTSGTTIWIRIRETQFGGTLGDLSTPISVVIE